MFSHLFPRVHSFALLFLRQLIPIQLFKARHGGMEAFRVDKPIWIVGVPLLVLLVHIKLVGVGCQRDVDFSFPSDRGTSARKPERSPEISACC